MKQLVSHIAQSSFFTALLAMLEHSATAHPHMLAILTYHRVDWPDAHPSLDPDLISATPEAFEQHMAYLAANYTVVSIEDVLSVFQNGATLPLRSVLLTFDDAYVDFDTYSWPILKRYRLPATLFVPSAFPSHPERCFWWDRLFQAVYYTDRQGNIETPVGRLPIGNTDQRKQAYSRLNAYIKSLPHHQAMAQVEQICETLDAGYPEHYILSWEKLRKLASEGVSIGSHTQTHPLMHRISSTQAHQEVTGSLHDIEREVGSTLPALAYPGGGLNASIVQILQAEGVALAFTSNAGINDLSTADPLQLKRINIGMHSTLPILRIKLLAWPGALHRYRPIFTKL